MRAARLIGLVLLAALVLGADAPPAAPPLSVADLVGTWAGTVTHDGESQPVALSFTADSASRITISLSMPVVHLDRAPLGLVRMKARGDSLQLGPFVFAVDARAGTLSGVVPLGLIPVYAIPITLRRVERFDVPERPAIAAPEPEGLWTFDAGSPLWAGPTLSAGTVYVGGQDGALHAIDARDGQRRWVYRTGGPIRVRPSVAGGAVLAQSDDGFLYAVDAKRGTLRWRVKTVDGTIVRLPFDNPESRFDRFGSDVVANGGRLYLGTHDGKMLALDPRDGRTLWSFTAGGAVLAAPTIADGRVLFGSYDHSVYALEAATGRPLWKRDTRGAVVSTPAVDGDRVVIGNRCYDLLGLDARTGDVAWKRYIWMSWVESSATILDGVAYVGSSDAAAVYAFDARSGKRLWSADVFGWSWGQPAVSRDRVYLGTSSQVGYLAQHAGGVMALDRSTGTVAWRHAAAAPDSGAYGFPGSPALGEDRVFVAGLDGRVRAFRR